MSRRSEIESRLDETAVIVQSNIAGYAQTGAAIYYVVRYVGSGDSAHDLVAYTAPLGTKLRDEAVIGKVVNHHGSTLRQVPKIAQGDHT